MISRYGLKIKGVYLNYEHRDILVFCKNSIKKAVIKTALIFCKI